MKKYIVIGNPIEHSLSPDLHNYWIEKNNIKAIYEKKLLNEDQLNDLFSKLKKEEINGINVTVPFKNSVISFIDKLSPEAEKTQSVNTIYFNKSNIIGHNTDIAGFELGLRHYKYDVNKKKILILGAGGVVPSIIFALIKMGAHQITLTNRTKIKAEKIQKIFSDIKVIDWGKTEDFDMIINATSVGLNKNDNIDFDLSEFGKNKFFYDVIYNPKETNFLKKAKKLGNQTENGKMMFIYQAHQAFFVWHKILPKIDEEVLKLIDK